MNKEMMKRWNSVVSDEDTVYYIGDFSMRFEVAQIWAPALRGTKILVHGNHDKTWIGRKDFQEYVQKYKNLGFLEIVTEMKLKLPLFGQETVVKLHHMPYSHKDRPKEANKPDKYEKYRPIDEGEILLCGHVHDAWEKIGRQVNVGVDVNNFTPITIEEIERKLSMPDSVAKGNYRDSL